MRKIRKGLNSLKVLGSSPTKQEIKRFKQRSR